MNNDNMNNNSISMYFDMSDPYRLYGINHFMQKYGIQFSFNTESESKINIVYGDTSRGINGFNIYISENELGGGICGHLKIEDEKVPLFEKPMRVAKSGENLVVFVDNKGDEYPCVVLNDTGITIGFDIFNEVGHILTGYFEHFWEIKENKHEKLAKIPVVDYYEKILFDCLLIVFRRFNLSLKYKPFWPDGKKFAVCLTHDVDRVYKSYQYITHFVRYIRKGDFRSAMNQITSAARKLQGDEPYWNFDRIMEIERNLGVKSTFFFLNEQKKACLFSPSEWKLYWGRYDIKDKRIVEVIKKLDAEGWEIGVHGSYNSYRNLEMMREEKETLEEILGKRVHGISQHYCNLEIPSTWEYQEKLGFIYDSTIGLVNDLFFRYGTCFPFHPFNPIENRILTLWELPITIVDNTCSKKDTWNEILRMPDTIERSHGLLVLRWHQSIFNEREFPMRASIYERVIKQAKERGAWVTTAHEIADWCDSRVEEIELLGFSRQNMDSYIYIVVTPCKNEAHNLPRLIESMVSQRIKPALWVIVDDGSTDGTLEIIKDAERKYKWIKGVSLEATMGIRDRGIHLARVIRKGFDFAVKYSMEKGIKFDYLSNVDGDIILESTFFDKLIKEFKKDPLLGIASGTTRYILDGKVIIDETSDENEPPGGHMVIRRECYEECDGIPLSYAVDSALKAKARLRGWRTKKFDAIAIEVRPVHSAEGYWRGYKEKGEAAYYLNLNPFHVIFNAVRYLFKKPCYIGLAYFAGYFGYLLQKKGRVKDEELRRYFRNKWKDKLRGKLRLTLERPN